MVRRFRGPENLAGVLALCLSMLGLQQVAAAGTVKAKAWLAPLLIERAWSRSLAAGGQSVKPWPWADTWPVARLRAESGRVDLMVLEGDTGNALAFGPGHAAASASLGTPGLAVIGGHRDTHFAFLRHVRVGDTLELQPPGGEWRRYRVAKRRVINAEREMITPEPGVEKLLLVTCYPFDALLPGGPLRLVVEAIHDPGNFIIDQRAS